MTDLFNRKVEPFRAQSAAGGSYMRPSEDGSRPVIFYVNTYDLPTRRTWTAGGARMTSDSLLYHYTDAAGLIGMVTQRKIWATSLSHMNDEKEDVHGAHVIAQCLRQLANSDSGPKRDFLESAASTFFNGHPKRWHYSFSLSANPDMLSQWRAYAPLGGYCVAFDREWLEEFGSRHGFKLRQCLYAEDDQKQLALREISRFISLFDDWNLDYAECQKRISALSSHTESFRGCLKHSSFREEGEWRLLGHLSATDHRCRFRPAGPYVKPYVELSMKAVCEEERAGPISEVYCGPGLDSKRAFEALTLLFMGARMKTPSIRQSVCPYRL